MRDDDYDEQINSDCPRNRWASKHHSWLHADIYQWQWLVSNQRTLPLLKVHSYHTTCTHAVAPSACRLLNVDLRIEEILPSVVWTSHLTSLGKSSFPQGDQFVSGDGNRYHTASINNNRFCGSNIKTAVVVLSQTSCQVLLDRSAESTEMDTLWSVVAILLLIAVCAIILSISFGFLLRKKMT